MPTSKSAVIAQLEKEILPLQGLKRIPSQMAIDPGLGPINGSFPEGKFPVGVIHEFCCFSQEEVAATGGFVSGLVSSFMQDHGVILWVSNCRRIFPPALKGFGIRPDHVIFIDLRREKDVLWATEEALKCDALSAVIAEVKELDFTASRRLQLSVEHSRVTGFIIKSARKQCPTASVTRWKITPVAGQSPGGLPGVGFPQWKVELLKVRNGKPGSWEVGWNGTVFTHPTVIPTFLEQKHKKTG